MKSYTPRPIDTSRIRLLADLIELTEKLAENAHEVWAAQRISEGWTYGIRRDDAARRHPDLIPYADLPESEKEYDRRTAMETLKAIVSLGYRISGAADTPNDESAQLRRRAEVAEEALRMLAEMSRVRLAMFMTEVCEGEDWTAPSAVAATYALAEAEIEEAEE